AGDVPPAVAANIQRFLNVIRARRRWQAHFGAAIAPDSNLNAASGERTIFLDTTFGRLPFTRQGDIAPKSGLGVSVWGGGEYQYPLAPRWRLRSGADASVREYKGGDFDRHFLAAHLGPRRLIGPGTEASLLATVERQWTAGMPETDRFGLRLEGEHVLTPRLGLFGRVSAARRNCRDCDWLDGPVGDVTLGASWAALPILRFGGNAGWHWSRANLEHWRNSGPQASLGATLALPAGFTVGLRASLQRTEYQGHGFAHNTIDRKPREDETHTLSVSVHNRALTVLGFSPRLSVVREERDTNAQALGYNRNRAEFSFVRQF
ncbi:MAG: surface lipoprotein assembly modifier, partial [Alphaproteobacteria bacterium]|nr:surface lipoprotein assembly modifier [Alphaproteobacteria bacterium]